MWRKREVQEFEWEGSYVRVRAPHYLEDAVILDFCHGHGCWDDGVSPPLHREDVEALVKAMQAWLDGPA